MKAFQLVEVEALLAVTLSAEPKFAILAEARAVFPKNLKADENKADPLAHAFLVIDLAMEAVVDPLHGTILVLGQLMPPSFVLNPSCQLTGGFALAYFLPASEHVATGSSPSAATTRTTRRRRTTRARRAAASPSPGRWTPTCIWRARRTSR